MMDLIDDFCKIDGRVVMKDNFETVIECDGIEITKDELWKEIKTYEGWDITITLKG